MRKVIWLTEAIDDLVRLREFIGDKNREAARRAATTIKNMAKILEDYPDIIHPLEDLPDFHDLVVPFGSGSYIVRYRIEENTVNIVGIRHSKEEGFRP
jgi:plasmid stabilization system protein ParE